jgi:hypothetical protein
VLKARISGESIGAPAPSFPPVVGSDLMRESDEGHEYSDSEIRIRLPEYVRQKKGRYFAASGRGKGARMILGVAVDIIDSDGHAASLRDNLVTARFIDWAGVQQRAVRRGETQYVAGGYELLSMSYNPLDHKILYNYTIILNSGGRWVYVAMHGQGEMEAFDDACHEIVSSIQLTAPGRGSNEEREEPTASPAASHADATPSSGPGIQRFGSYLFGKVKRGHGPVHSAVIFGDPGAARVRLYLMTRRGGAMFPIGATWHETEEAAKADAAESLGIGESDWTIVQGEPEWAPAFRAAVQDAVGKYVDATR